MNKRQKKKLVKQALINQLTLSVSKKDKHILKTIGKNEKVLRELNTNRMREDFSALFNQAKEIIEKIALAYVEVFNAVRDRMIEVARSQQDD